MFANSKQDQLLLDELAIFNSEVIDINGVRFSAAELYVISTDPVRVSFHENCPVLLRERIEVVINRFKK